MTTFTKVIFDSYDSFIKQRDVLFNNIRDNIYKMVVLKKKDDKYYCETCKGVCSHYNYYLMDVLYSELKQFTDNKSDDWCKSTSECLSFGVYATQNALNIIHKADMLTPDEYAQLIYNIIICQLCDEKHFPYYFEQVVEWK